MSESKEQKYPCDDCEDDCEDDSGDDYECDDYDKEEHSEED